MSNKKRTRKKKRPPLFLLLALLIICGGLTYYILSRPYFTITQTVLEGADLFDASAIEENLKPLIGQNLFFANTADVKKYLKGLSYLKSFKLRRRPPGILILRIKERLPFAIIIFEKGQSIIDNEGIILSDIASTQEQNLPIIRGISSADIKDARLQKKIKDSLVELLTFLRESLAEKKLQLEFKNNYAEINLLVDDILYVKLGSPSQLDEKLTAFKQLLKVIEGKWQYVEYINVMVPDNPVIKYIY